MAIIILFSWNKSVYSEIPRIKVKNLQCISEKDKIFNTNTKYHKEYWSITKNDNFAELTFLSSDGFEVVTEKFDVKRDLDYITFTRDDAYKSPKGFKMIYKLRRKDGVMFLNYLGSQTEYKCEPFKGRSYYDFLKSKAEKNLKKKKSDIRF